MQLMASKGWEVRETEGLGWVPGEVRRLQSKEEERVPHVGWEGVQQRRLCPLFANISSGTDFYFVHSYHLECRDMKDILACAEYCGGFTAAIAHDNLYGVQFHPEKSQKPGLQLLRNFLSF
jgi:glutamine amidotransferase